MPSIPVKRLVVETEAIAVIFGMFFFILSFIIERVGHP